MFFVPHIGCCQRCYGPPRTTCCVEKDDVSRLGKNIHVAQTLFFFGSHFQCYQRCSGKKLSTTFVKLDSRSRGVSHSVLSK